MRSVRLMLWLFIGFVGGAPAQVTVEVLLDQEQFLREESLPIRVRISNRSGQTLQLGKEKDWLTFRIENRDGSEVHRLGDVPVAGELSLESAEEATRSVDLMPYFDLSRSGRYTVTAEVKIKQWDHEITSKAKPFDIIRGTKIWEQNFGVPTTNAVPEIRKYALLQANNLKQLLLYLRLSDATDTMSFRVILLGRFVSFNRPEAQLDRISNLHVLFQTGAKTFVYTAVSPEGEVLDQQAYDMTDRRPMLSSGEAGKVFVSGGARRLLPGEQPPLPLPPATNDLPAAKPK